MANNETPAFPLLLLPEKAQTNLMKILVPHEMISISMLSKRALEMAKSSGLRSKKITLDVACSTSLTLRFEFENLKVVEIEIDQDDDGGIRAAAAFENGPIYGPNIHSEGLTAHGCIYRFLSVFNRNIINHVYFMHDLDDLEFFETVTNGTSWEEISFDDDTSATVFQETFKNHRPFPKVLGLFFKTTDKTFRKLSIQNWDTFCIAFYRNVNFNDLIVCNAKSVYFGKSSFSTKDLNRYTKLWISGTNPRLKRLVVEFRCVWNPEVTKDELTGAVFKGIVGHEQEEGEVRIFNIDNEDVNVEGGFKFCRYDGAEAIITFTPEENNYVSFTMYIWPNF